jgi:hypothetical protein
MIAINASNCPHCGEKDPLYSQEIFDKNAELDKIDKKKRNEVIFSSIICPIWGAGLIQLWVWWSIIWGIIMFICMIGFIISYVNYRNDDRKKILNEIQNLNIKRNSLKYL